MLQEAPGPAAVNGRRSETDLERCDRNLVELLQEVRVVQTGVQVLFAFLLTAPLAPRFPELTALQRGEYFATLLVTGAASVLLIAPTAYHRSLFRLGDKEHLVMVANRLTLAGLACVAVSMVGALLLVTDLLFDGPLVVLIAGTAALACVVLWCLAPLRRRRALAHVRLAAGSDRRE
jgi:O-antigen/teichoic acid export membrane protein